MIRVPVRRRKTSISRSSSVPDSKLTMSSNRRTRYKAYLEPDSDEPIPSSSWYRHKKRFTEQEAADPQLDVQNIEGNVILKHQESKMDEQQEYQINERGSLMEADNQNIAMDTDEVSENDNSLESSHSTQETSITFASKEESGEDRHVFSIVQSLAEEIDLIENETEHLVEGENEDVDDYFMDVIDYEGDGDSYKDTIEDNDHPLRNEEDEEETLSPKSFNSLQDAMSSEAFLRPINVPVNKTVGEVIFMILKFVLVHALSLTEITDLFVMINCIFAESFLPNTRYLIDKLFYSKNCTKLYATCSKCGAYIGKFERKDSFLECKICKTEIDVKNYTYKDFFVMMDVASPISKLIGANSEYYDHVMNHRVREKDCIRDIYDGKKYQEFLSDLKESDRHRYATVVFNTDGAPLFESSAYSIWPIFLMLNEIPYNVRSKELILAGLWFGKNKPNMKVFLEPFVEQMNQLASRGAECVINGIKVFVKIFTLVCSVDSVARAPVQGFTQFNGAFGCSQCLHPGEWVRNDAKNPRSGNIKYPVMNKVPKERTVDETIKHMMKAANSNKPIFGIKCPSQLINLLHYDIIYGCVIESLHCASGIAKQFATKWFGNKKKAGLFPRSSISKIDALMTNIKAPHQVVRLTRPFSEKEFWKAREWENWAIFYSMIILKNILPDQLLMHWALFVEAFYILSQAEIKIHELNHADDLLHEFVARSEMLYSKVSMTFNMHLLLHLTRSVLNWGPLWCHNAYAFESGNGNLLKVIHAAKGVHHQICRQISLKYSYLSLRDHVEPFASLTVKNYCNTIGKKMAKNTLQTNEIRYFGSASRVEASWLEKLGLSGQSFSFKKIVKSGCLYMSSGGKNKRSDNSYAQLTNGTYVKINNFVVHMGSLTEYTIVQKMLTTNAYNNACGMLQRIVKIATEQSAVLTNDIAKVCVHMAINDIQCVTAVPNLHYY